MGGIAMNQQSRSTESRIIQITRCFKAIPGIGPICALTILAEAGDLRRFSHYKKLLRYCGLDFSTQ